MARQLLLIWDCISVTTFTGNDIIVEFGPIADFR